jgi:hypothetical protein
MLPTIVGWSVQWKFSAFELATVSVLLVAPGAMLPESQLPLSATKWCSVPSLFLNATVWPVPTGAGFGLNAALPAEPTMFTVTLAPVPVEGVDVGVVVVDPVDEGEAGVE